MYPNSYNYYPQSQNPYLNRYMPTNQYTQQLQGLKGRPVSSLEEVRATGIDFDGSVFYFPDLANRRIYTKQINLDGTASLLQSANLTIQNMNQTTDLLNTLRPYPTPAYITCSPYTANSMYNAFSGCSACGN